MHLAKWTQFVIRMYAYWARLNAMQCHAMQCQLYSFATTVRSRPYTEYVNHATYLAMKTRSISWYVRACLRVWFLESYFVRCMPIRNEAWYVHYARCAGMCLATYDGTWTYSMMTVIRPLKCVAHSVQVYVLLRFVYSDGLKVPISIYTHDVSQVIVPDVRTVLVVSFRLKSYFMEWKSYGRIFNNLSY